MALQLRSEEIKAELDGLRDDYLIIIELLTEWGERFAGLRGLIMDEQHRLDAAPADLMSALNDRNSELTATGEPRMRASALKRRPRAHTNAEVLNLMKEHRHEWLAAAELADIVADDDEELFDYLRASYQKALRDGLNRHYDVRKQTGKATKSGRQVGWIEQYRYKERS